MPKIIAFGTLIMACGLSTLAAQAQVQEWKPKMILFHVTSVQRADDPVACKSGKCNVVRYKVEGYADIQQGATTTEYVITCDEHVTSRPLPHRDNVCARFHAGNAYTAQLLSDSVSFPYSMLNKDFETDYNIVSEREMARAPEQPEVTKAPEKREATRGPEQPVSVKGLEQMASKAGN
jgi:hypothetical protein